MPAGYSGTPLVKKLDLREGQRAALVAAPDHFLALLVGLPETVRVLARPGPDMDYLHLFARSRADLERRLPALRKKLADHGMLWVSWPKKSSPLWRDLTEDHVRELAKGLDLVDVKVCAVDEDWSGLKLVVPKGSRR